MKSLTLKTDKSALLERTLRIYRWPSQAFWRYLEVRTYDNAPMDHPILEIGCGDGNFTTMIVDYVDEAIDVNPHAIAKSRKLGNFYRRLSCLDARDLEPQKHGFSTVYANCVVEHIPELDSVLRGCYRALRPGGNLVITVPLRRMNDFLLFSFERYARIRQRQLSHINLLTINEWKECLQTIGFNDIQFRPYLSGQECRLWDSIDGIGCLGSGRFTLANVVGRGLNLVLPKSTMDSLRTRIALWLLSKEDPTDSLEEACATLIVAQKER